MLPWLVLMLALTCAGSVGTLPVLGGLFGTKGRTHTRSELIIFMTPHVIYDETNLVEASDELKARVKLLRKMVKDL